MRCVHYVDRAHDALRGRIHAAADAAERVLPVCLVTFAAGVAVMVLVLASLPLSALAELLDLLDPPEPPAAA